MLSQSRVRARRRGRRSLVRCLSHHKAQGYQIIATHLDASAKPLSAFDFTQPTALVLGNERDGVSPQVLAMSDARAIIPMDGGATRGFILKYWQGRAAHADGARRDAKTELQEWTHARYGAPPNYKVADRSGPDHDPRFTVIVEIPGLKPEIGIDRSKRAAEQVAATKILEREGVWAKPSDAN